jgi:hypothetical protein
MEPETAAFFRKIGYTVLVVFLWMGITAAAALFRDSAFIEDKIRLANGFFYLWFVLSLVLVIKILKKLWKSENETST